MFNLKSVFQGLCSKIFGSDKSNHSSRPILTVHSWVLQYPRKNKKYSMTDECYHCRGTGEGRFSDSQCMWCKGRGYFTHYDNNEVDVPYESDYDGYSPV